MTIETIKEWRQSNPARAYSYEPTKKTGYIVTNGSCYVWVPSMEKAKLIKKNELAMRPLKNWEYSNGLSKLEAFQS